MRNGVDVIVVNYRTPGDLEGFIKSYLDSVGIENTSLYIVNVQPEQADEEILTPYWPDLAEQDTHYIAHNENVGYARAVNNAAARGDRECIAIFNADTVLSRMTLEECYGALWTLTPLHAAILGPRLLDERGRITHAGITGTHEKPEMRGWLRPDNEIYEDTLQVVMVSGSAFFIRRNVWDALTECPAYREIAPDAEGAFLPTQHYYEETWCCYHAKAHGWNTFYYGPAKMIHKWHRASPAGGFGDRQMPASRTLFRAACDAHGIPHD